MLIITVCQNGMRATLFPFAVARWGLGGLLLAPNHWRSWLSRDLALHWDPQAMLERARKLPQQHCLEPPALCPLQVSKETWCCKENPWLFSVGRLERRTAVERRGGKETEVFCGARGCLWPLEMTSAMLHGCKSRQLLARPLGDSLVLDFPGCVYRDLYCDVVRNVDL